MVTVTSDIHKVTVTLPRNATPGREGELEAYSSQIDVAVSRLMDKCAEDKLLVEELRRCKNKEDATRLVIKHLKGATAHAPWLRAWVGPALCHSVIDCLLSEHIESLEMF